jgi:pimeloyl-ACP methyl ester carboxylesterase
MHRVLIVKMEYLKTIETTNKVVGMSYIDLDEVRLFVTDEGSGDPPLLLVHGWACDSHDWIWQIPAFAAHHRVIAPALRGHGRSDVPPDGYDPRDYARDLAQLVRRLDLPPVVAVGHSLGGIVVSMLAVEHPDVVAGVVVVDPPYGLDGAAVDDGIAFARALSGDVDANAVAAARLAGAEGATTPLALATWHSRRTLGVPRHVLAQTAAAVHGSPEAIANAPATTTLLAARAHPVLALHATAARAGWEGGLLDDERSRAMSFDGCGHWLHQERPDEFNAAVLAWVETLRA